MKREYLSDEELDRLVNAIEAKPLYPAPEYLKPMILKKARAYDRSVTKQPAGIRLFTYGMKIMAAAVAAAILLLTVPVMDKAQSLDYMEQSAQLELERIRERAAVRELAQIQHREESMERVSMRRAFAEDLAVFTGWGRGNSISQADGGNSRKSKQ